MSNKNNPRFTPFVADIIPGTLSVSVEYLEDQTAHIPCLFFKPPGSRDHHHIEMTQEQGSILGRWLTEYHVRCRS